MPVQVKFTVDPQAAKQVEKFGQKALIGMGLGLQRVAFELKKSVQQLLRNSKRGGRVYKIGKNRFHKSSAPGDAPARDTGNLMNKIVGRLKDPITAVVEASANYAAYLEEGTSKMKARPFLKPALEQNRDVIDRIIKSEIEKAIG